MQKHTTISRTSATTRSAMAPLEFVMALPVLLLLMVAITWLGFSVIGQTEVLVKARNKAWQRRFENASKKPLYFPILKGLYDEKSDYVFEQVKQRVDVSPIFSRVPGPEGGHMILAGSWDHRAMSFAEPPDLKLMAVAAAIGTFGNGLDAVASLDDPLGLIKEIGEFASAGKQTKRDNDSASSNVGKGGEDTGGSGGGTPPPGAPQSPEEGEAKSKEDQRKKKEELKRRREALGGQIIYTLNGEQVIAVDGEMKAVQDEIDRLDKEKYKLEPQIKLAKDEEKEKLQAEYDRLSRQVELQEIKYERLKAEFLDVDAELKALD
jgi:hypothetical protein